MRRTQAPDLDGAVQTGGSERVGVFRIDRQPHNIVAMSLEDLHAFPALFPIPKFDRHIIGRGEDERLCRVDDDGSDIVWMRFK